MDFMTYGLIPEDVAITFVLSGKQRNLVHQAGEGTEEI
jgi:hypothetical protein